MTGHLGEKPSSLPAAIATWMVTPASYVWRLLHRFALCAAIFILRLANTRGMCALLVLSGGHDTFLPNNDAP